MTANVNFAISYYMGKTKFVFLMGKVNCRGAAYSHRDYRNRQYNVQKHVWGKCMTTKWSHKAAYDMSIHCDIGDAQCIRLL